MATDVPVPGIGTTASSVASPSGGGTRSSQGRPSCGPGGVDSHDQASSCVSASPSPGGTEPIVHLSDRLCQERERPRRSGEGAAAPLGEGADCRTGEGADCRSGRRIGTTAPYRHIILLSVTTSMSHPCRHSDMNATLMSLVVDLGRGDHGSWRTTGTKRTVS